MVNPKPVIDSAVRSHDISVRSAAITVRSTARSVRSCASSFDERCGSADIERLPGNPFRGHLPVPEDTDILPAAKLSARGQLAAELTDNRYARQTAWTLR